MAVADVAVSIERRRRWARRLGWVAVALAAATFLLDRIQEDEAFRSRWIDLAMTRGFSWFAEYFDLRPPGPGHLGGHIYIAAGASLALGAIGLFLLIDSRRRVARSPGLADLLALRRRVRSTIRIRDWALFVLVLAIGTGLTAAALAMAFGLERFRLHLAGWFASQNEPVWAQDVADGFLFSRPWIEVVGAQALFAGGLLGLWGLSQLIIRRRMRESKLRAAVRTELERRSEEKLQAIGCVLAILLIPVLIAFYSGSHEHDGRRHGHRHYPGDRWDDDD